MSFDIQEKSQESGQPVELYEFAVSTTFFRFTSNETDYTHLANIYTAIPIQRDEIGQTTGDRQDNLTVVMPSDLALSRLFIFQPPTAKVTFRLLRVHRNDLAQESIVLFRGTVSMAAYVSEAKKVQLQILSLTSGYNRTMPRMTFQGLCNHNLYDTLCTKLEFDPSFEKFLPVTAVLGNTITVTGAGSFGADFFEAGFVAFQGDFRMVTKQTVDVLTLLLPFANSPLGQTVRCLAGCKHDIGTCNTKFNNVINFGGHPYVPLTNLFVTGLD